MNFIKNIFVTLIVGFSTIFAIGTGFIGTVFMAIFGCISIVAAGIVAIFCTIYCCISNNDD